MRGGYSSGTKNLVCRLPDRATAGVNAEMTSHLHPRRRVDSKQCGRWASGRSYPVPRRRTLLIRRGTRCATAELHARRIQQWHEEPRCRYLDRATAGVNAETTSHLHPRRRVDSKQCGRWASGRGHPVPRRRALLIRRGEARCVTAELHARRIQQWHEATSCVVTSTVPLLESTRRRRPTVHPRRRVDSKQCGRWASGRGYPVPRRRALLIRRGEARCATAELHARRIQQWHEEPRCRYLIVPLLESTRRRRPTVHPRRRVDSKQCGRWASGRSYPVPRRRALLIRRGDAGALPQNSMRGGYSSGTKNLVCRLPDRATAGVNAETTSHVHPRRRVDSKQCGRWASGRGHPVPRRRALLIRRGDAVRHSRTSMRGGYSSGTKNLRVDHPTVPLLESTRRRRPMCIRVVALTPSSVVVGRVDAATPFRGAAHC